MLCPPSLNVSFPPVGGSPVVYQIFFLNLKGCVERGLVSVTFAGDAARYGKPSPSPPFSLPLHPLFNIGFSNSTDVVRHMHAVPPFRRTYSKNQYGSIQSKKRAGGKAAYNNQKRKMQGGMNKWKL